MTTLVTVPQGGGALDVLAARYRTAFDKVNRGRAQSEAGRALWIEGTLELSDVVLGLRKRYRAHGDFSRWVTRYGLEQLHPNDRAALVGFGDDPQAARKLLEESSSFSWRVIWEKRPRAALTKLGKGRLRASSTQDRKHASGYAKRNRIPDVMRDDPPEPRPERKAILLKGLTREQVDPDFKGTPLEFTTKYGHVNLHTKAEIEHTKRQEVLAAWLGTIADLDRASRAMLVALAAVDPATLQEWTRKPLKAEKMRAWCNSIQVACEAARKLCPPLGGV